MKSRLSTAICMVGVLCTLVSCNGPDGPRNKNAGVEDWIELFNGQDLSGWIPKIRGEAPGRDSLETFRATGGAIRADYSGYELFGERFGHLFYERPFSHYRLNVVYRFTGDQLPDGPGWAFRNSGLMLHSQDPASMGVDQDFPISIEVQLLGGDGVNERPTANLCTPGTHVVMEGELETRHCINAQSPTFHGDDWVEVEVIVLGDSLIAHAVEGAPVLGYSKPQMGGGSVDGAPDGMLVEGKPLRSGYISVQSESHPVEFSRVQLLDLSGCMDPMATNFKSYLEHNEPSTCRY